MRTRSAAAAGSFYPDDPRALAALVDRLLAEARPPVVDRPRALVVPHAGYAYSGPVAASAYATLSGGIDRVVLVGPAHFEPVAGVAVPSFDTFATPLGPVAVDDDARGAALGIPGVELDDEAHAFEHSLEVQLPFLLRSAGTVPVLPLLVGARSDVELVACVLEAAAPGAQDLVVCSSDLSHYYDDATAKRLDRRTADAILALDPDGIGIEDACGRPAVRGLLTRARRAGWSVTLLDLRTSADTAGDAASVVGYGAFAMSAARS